MVSEGGKEGWAAAPLPWPLQCWLPYSRLPPGIGLGCVLWWGECSSKKSAGSPYPCGWSELKSYYEAPPHTGENPPRVEPATGLGPDVSMQLLAQSPGGSMEVCRCFHGHHAKAREGRGGGEAPHADPGRHGGQRSAHKQGRKADCRCQCTLIMYRLYPLWVMRTNYWPISNEGVGKKTWNEAESSQVVGLQRLVVLDWFSFSGLLLFLHKDNYHTVVGLVLVGLGLLPFFFFCFNERNFLK